MSCNTCTGYVTAKWSSFPEEKQKAIKNAAKGAAISFGVSFVLGTLVAGPVGGLVAGTVAVVASVIHSLCTHYLVKPAVRSSGGTLHVGWEALRTIATWGIAIAICSTFLPITLTAGALLTGAVFTLAINLGYAAYTKSWYVDPEARPPLYFI